MWSVLNGWYLGQCNAFFCLHLHIGSRYLTNDQFTPVLVLVLRVLVQCKAIIEHMHSHGIVTELSQILINHVQTILHFEIASKTMVPLMRNSNVIVCENEKIACSPHFSSKFACVWGHCPSFSHKRGSLQGFASSPHYMWAHSSSIIWPHRCWFPLPHPEPRLPCYLKDKTVYLFLFIIYVYL